MRYTNFRFLIYFMFALLCAPAWANKLVTNGATLTVNDKNIVVQNGSKTIIDLRDIAFNYQSISWEVIQSSASEIVLQSKLPASVDFYRTPEDTVQRELEIKISTVEGGFRFFAQPSWGRQVTLELAHLGDHFFGLSAPLQPNNQLTPDLTGTHINVDIHSEGAAIRENYASAYSAFYMSSFAYGAFFDTFARGQYDFAINGKNRIHHDSGTLDWYIFVGEDGTEIHRNYYSLIGEPKKVPAWGLGPVGWRDQNDGGAKEIIDDIEKMNALKIPFTSWFVDRPYSDGDHAWSKMNFRKDFAEPEKWIKKIREEFGMEFMTWVATSTFGDKRFEKHLEGKFTYIDLSHENSVKAYQSDLTKKQYKIGVKGHKIDRADESFPLSEEWEDGTPIAERRNKYAYLMAKHHHDTLEEFWGEDQITFARTAIHRTQPWLSAIWGGDPRTTWEGLQSNFANAMRSSFMGFPVWGTDVGGYQGEGYIPEDLYLRWMQAGSMTGLFEIKLDGAGGDGRDRMPWRYDETFQQRFRAICEDRMKLVPYLFSLATTSAKNGVLMQPMAYRHLEDKKTYSMWDQFYVGDAILVAPVFDAAMSRDVYLPKGLWRNFDKPSVWYKGGKTITVDADLDTLPRFVKENSIYVTGNLFRGNDRLWAKGKAERLNIHVFPAKKIGSQQFDYVDLNDEDQVKSISLTRKNKKINLSSPALANAAHIEIALKKAPKSASLNGKKLAFHFDQVNKIVSFEVAEKSAFDLQVNL